MYVCRWEVNLLQWRRLGIWFVEVVLCEGRKYEKIPDNHHVIKKWSENVFLLKTKSFSRR